MTYTTHGHHIPGSPKKETPAKQVARCGGPGVCDQCSKDAARWLEKNEPVVEPAEGEGVEVMLTNGIGYGEVQASAHGLQTGWWEWWLEVDPDKVHIARVEESGGIYLPELGVSYAQFHEAVAMNRAFPLARTNKVLVEVEKPESIFPKEYVSKGESVLGIRWTARNFDAVVAFTGENEDPNGHRNFRRGVGTSAMLYVADIDQWVSVEPNEWVVRTPTGYQARYEGALLNFYPHMSQEPERDSVMRFSTPTRDVSAFQIEDDNEAVTRFIRKHGYSADAVSTYIRVYFQGSVEIAHKGDWIIFDDTNAFELLDASNFERTYYLKEKNE